MKVGSGARRPDLVDDPPGLALPSDAKLTEVATDRQASESETDAGIGFEPGDAIGESLDDGCQLIIGPRRSP